MTTAPVLRPALRLIGVLALLLGGVLAVTLDVGPLQEPSIVPVLLCLPFVFWGYIGAGLLAWWRRPRNGVGALLVWCGVATWFIGAGNTTVPAFAFAGHALATFVVAALAHLMLAFPSGRLEGVLARATVVGLYLVTCGVGIATWTLLAAGGETEAAIAGVLSVAQSIAANVLLGITTVILVVRVVRADRGNRMSLLPVYVTGIFTLFFVPAIALLFQGAGGDPAVRAVLQIAAIAIMPVAVVLAFLRGGYRRTFELEELSAWLGGGDASRASVRDALATALGDPGLSLAYWAAESGEWVDLQGRRVDAPPSGRVRAELAGESGPVAAIDYDRMLHDESEVRRAGALVMLALERNRLTAELRASRQELIESRRRIADAALVERHRIARDLHDGLQARLVLLGIDAQRIARAPGDEVAARSTGLRRDIDAVAAELRALVHDLMPPALVELGLAPALADLVERMPVPTTFTSAPLGDLDERTGVAAYFVTAEALANVVKHAEASSVALEVALDGDRLRIEVRDDGAGGADPARGSGLRGIMDRVNAIGGSVDVASPVGGGTALRLELPCG